MLVAAASHLRRSARLRSATGCLRHRDYVMGHHSATVLGGKDLISNLFDSISILLGASRQTVVFIS